MEVNQQPKLRISKRKEPYLIVDLENVTLLQLACEVQRLLVLDLLAFVLEPLERFDALFFTRCTLGSFLLASVCLRTAGGGLFLLAGRELLEELTPAGNERTMKLQTFALRLGGGYKRCKLGLLLLCADRRRRGNSLERIVQATREGLQTRTDKLARRALDLALAWRCGGRTGHRGRGRRATIDRICVVHEEDAAHRMINANPQLAAAGAAHDVCLDLGVVERGHRTLDAGLDRRGEFEQLINRERRVDLRELG
jgi:hypothetical protein